MGLVCAGDGTKMKESLCIVPKRNDLKALPWILVAMAMLAEGREAGWRVAGDGDASCHNQHGSSSEGSLSVQTGRTSRPLLQKEQGLKSCRRVCNKSVKPQGLGGLAGEQPREVYVLGQGECALGTRESVSLNLSLCKALG